MVKLAFNSALGQKDLKKEEKDEALIPQDVVSFVSSNANRLKWLKTTLVLSIKFFITFYFGLVAIHVSINICQHKEKKKGVFCCCCEKNNKVTKTVVLIDIRRYLDFVTETPCLSELCEDYKIIFVWQLCFLCM